MWDFSSSNVPQTPIGAHTQPHRYGIISMKTLKNPFRTHWFLFAMTMVVVVTMTTMMTDDYDDDADGGGVRM